MALTVNFTSIDLKNLKTSAAAARSSARPKSRKCLFGPSNHEETYQMVKENFDRERKRFFQRFGIHMEDLDRLAIDEAEYRRMKCCRPALPSPSHPPTAAASSSAARAPSGGGKMVNRKVTRMKRALKPYNADNQQQQQTKITDFCQVKKSPTSAMPPSLPIDAASAVKNKLSGGP